MRTMKCLITGAALLLATATVWAWSGDDADVEGSWRLQMQEQVRVKGSGCSADGVMILNKSIVKGGTAFDGTAQGIVSCPDLFKGDISFPFAGNIEGSVDGSDIAFTLAFTEGGPGGPLPIKGCPGDDDDDGDDELFFQGTVTGDFMEGDFDPEDCLDKGAVGTWTAERFSTTIPTLGPIGLAVTALVLLGAGLLARRRRMG